MLNFAVGPVQAEEEILAIGSEQVPYFRTDAFSLMMKENEDMLLRLSHAGKGARAVFLTGSGTAAMEAAVMHCLSSGDRALVVNGGSFGKRFCSLLEMHGIDFTEISLEYGADLLPEQLEPFEGMGYTAFLVNADETTTGVIYDLPMIGDFCRRNGLFLIIDAISSFLSDPFDMEGLGADVMIASSQKALACPPGLSFLCLSPNAQDRVARIPDKSMYLSLSEALLNGERGQTPFTPAIGVARQLHRRLRQIEALGGAEAEVRRTAALAADLRRKVEEAELPFSYVSKTRSNALTAYHPPEGISAFDLFLTLQEEYDIWICPNGGSLRDTVFRVGHIGFLKPEDNSCLVQAFCDIRKSGRL